MNISKPMAGLTAVLCSLGLMTAGAMGAQAAEPAAGGLPDHVVNGDFEYPGVDFLQGAKFAYVSTVEDTYFLRGGSSRIPLPASFDQEAFAWTSSQITQAAHPDLERAGDVQVFRSETGNRFAELTAAQEGTAIYQDIATVPGTTLTWSLKHASLTDAHTDGMRVLIGAPGEETAQEATRTSVNGNGDTLGPVGTLIETTASRPTENGDGPLLEPEWESYEGTYLVPEGQTVTRLTFENTSGIDRYSGNLLDDITLQVGWPLDYQLNGGTGTIPNKEGE